VRTVEGVTPENPKGFRNIKFWNSMRLGWFKILRILKNLESSTF
jgi:hypothetical protein